MVESRPHGCGIAGLTSMSTARPGPAVLRPRRFRRCRRHRRPLPEQDLGHRGGGFPVEVRQQALDRVEPVVAGDRRASGVRTIRPSSCVMWVWSCRGAERHEHLGTWAVPAGGDGVLGEQHPDVWPVLHRLGADVGHGVAAELQRRVVAEHMRDRVVRQVRPRSRIVVQRRRGAARRIGVFGTWTTSSGTTGSAVSSCAFAYSRHSAVASTIFRSARVEQHRVEAARPRQGSRAGCRPSAGRTPARAPDRRPPADSVCAPRRRGHRVVEPLDRGGDAPHDRDRRHAVRPVDQPLHDGLLLRAVRLLVAVMPRCASSRTRYSVRSSSSIVFASVSQIVNARSRARLRSRSHLGRALVRPFGAPRTSSEFFDSFCVLRK